MDSLLIYDIEVFKYDSLVVFKNINNEVVRYFWSLNNKTIDEPNGFEEVKEFIKDKTLIGYNNFYYDDVILTLMMNGYPQKVIKIQNDALIANDCTFKASKEIRSLDTIQQIDVSRPSLKQIEGNMGKSILESSVPFDIDRPLTDEEKEEVLKYCCYDVQTTIDIYKLRKKSYFDTKEALMKMVEGVDMHKYNTTTIVAKILMPERAKQWQGLRIDNRKENLIPKDVWELWDSWRPNQVTLDKKKKSINKIIYDCEFTFGFGGLHGANVHNKKFTNVKLLDVGSMYPSIITLLNALEGSTELYDNIRKERLSIKHSDPVRAGALKLILNSTYGLLKNEYSTLLNPFASTTVCVFGQIALFDLCSRLYDAGYQLININTDGVAFNQNKEVNKSYEEIWKEWEQEYNLTLELDEFDFWYQKDVNNYVATHDGKIKVKGGEVNKYESDKFFSNNNLRICQIALVEKLVNGIDPLNTIHKYLYKEFNPLLFQMVLKCGRTFQGTYDKNNNKYQNVNRIFAWKDRYSSECNKLYKKREDGGLVNFPDTPDNMYLFNDDLKEINKEEFIRKIDVNFYYSLVMNKLEGWK